MRRDEWAMAGTFNRVVLFRKLGIAGKEREFLISSSSNTEFYPQIVFVFCKVVTSQFNFFPKRY
jgi:hypothetical protein